MAAQDSLKVSAILGRTASGASTGVPDVDQEELRFAITATLAPGYLPSMIDQTANTSAFNVRQDTGSNMQVKVGSGTTKKDGYVILGTAAGQGAYIVRLDAATKTLTVPATDATNPARYGVYLYVDDAAYSGTASRAYANIACIRGTPAGSPTTPGPLATYSAYALLWEFQLAANATAVTNTILDNTSISTDRRVAAGTLSNFVGCILTRSGVVNLATSYFGTMAFDVDTRDTHGFHAAGADTITIPTGMGGIYIGQFRLTGPSASSTSNQINLNTGTPTFANPISTTGTQTISGSPGVAAMGPTLLAAGDVVRAIVNNSTGGAQNYTGTLVLQRIAI